MICGVTTTERRRVRVTGIVQGVGFRPFVHRLATDLHLVGFVGNDSSGVFIEVQADAAVLDRFLGCLRAEAPPLAQVQTVTAEPIGVECGARGFEIVESTPGDGLRTLVPPDVAVCAECRYEVEDPTDRRYRYPFANCTNCGPRYTIIRDLPYDRPATTMAAFEMCRDCASEYEDPSDRRYHAQPIACPACGPGIGWKRDGRTVAGTDPVIGEFQLAVARGEVVAVKGIGGYHLACDATNPGAVSRLRERKGRVDKPFAVMLPSVEAVDGVVVAGAVEYEALSAPAHPIVLAPRRESGIVDLVAPGNPLLGVMLPYSPLHHLLFTEVPGADVAPPAALVMTSGNRSNEPICFDDDEARQRLADLADAFLTHDRPIEVPCDDSVVRIVDGEVQPIRRSRGFAPVPVALPVPVVPTLAVGAELKNTFCLAAGRHAWVGPHVGDMENLETLAAFERGVDGFERMYGVEPELLAADEHPAYLTRRWALQRSDPGDVVDVQHHHAHVASVMAENGHDGSTRVLGVAFDGTGFGHDSEGDAQIWGGEFLLADYERYERIGHLAPLPLPGGDQAIRNPCRTAVAYLSAIGIELDPVIPAVAACDEVERNVVARQVERNVGCIPSTSMGRLFDAIASLLGVRHRVTYEAQAAIELEALATTAADPVALSFDVCDGVADPRPLIAALVDDLAVGAPTPALALGFHHAVADMVRHLVESTRGDVDTVALTGGVFQNALLTGLTRRKLDPIGVRVLTHRLVPPNDGGLALGQAVVAGHRGAMERT